MVKKLIYKQYYNPNTQKILSIMILKLSLGETWTLHYS